MFASNLLDKYSENRNQLADLLKGVAVVFMIMIHLTNNLATLQIEKSAVGEFINFLGGPPAAPLFMIIMGYFLGFSKRDTFFNIKRGVKLFIGGILLNIGINFSALIQIVIGNSEANPLNYIFGVDILLLAGLSIVFITIIKSLLRDFAEACFLLSIIVVLASEIMIKAFAFDLLHFNYVTALFWGRYERSYFSLFPWLAFPLVGFALAQFQIKNRSKFNLSNKTKWGLLVLWAIGFVATYNYAAQISAVLPVYYKFDLQFYIWMLLFLLGFVLLINEIHSFSPNYLPFKYIKWIGENVLLFYVFQWIIIGNLTTYYYKTIEAGNVVILFAVVLLAVSVLTLVTKRMKKFYVLKTG